MNWKNKIMVFKILSTIPFGEKIYGFLQRNFTKSIVLTESRLQAKADIATRYWDWLEKNASGEYFKSHVDFGAGWHPTIPLYFHTLGFTEQHLLDIRPFLTKATVEETFRIYNEVIFPGLEEQGFDRKPVYDSTKGWSENLVKQGIHYQAPYGDELIEGLEGKIDLVTSTQVLLYISREPMVECFRNIHRMLRPGGLFLAETHLYDLWSDSDPSLSKYNHLQYSKELWESEIDSAMMPFNRFKEPDYLSALEEAGFEIVVSEVEGPTEADLNELRAMKVDPYFSHLSEEVLGGTFQFFVARKK
ncbi:class I SAM-dependent methyltransferase [Akkermansiaceae bacterium]|nr:class I SAM-dependent methyltransferase [Akkermansiaceae bacterium]